MNSLEGKFNIISTGLINSFRLSIRHKLITNNIVLVKYLGPTRFEKFWPLVSFYYSASTICLVYGFPVGRGTNERLAFLTNRV